MSSCGPLCAESMGQYSFTIRSYPQMRSMKATTSSQEGQSPPSPTFLQNKPESSHRWTPRYLVSHCGHSQTVQSFLLLPFGNSATGTSVKLQGQVLNL